MVLILCFIGLIAFTWYAWTSFNPLHTNRRIFKIPGNPEQKFLMPRGMFYITFIVVSAPLFLGNLSLIKYFVFFLISVYYILNYKFNNLLRGGPIVISYMLFLLWLIVTWVYSPYPYYGFLNIVKYSLPLVALWVAYNALRTKEDLIVFLKLTCYGLIFYVFWVSGIAFKFYPVIAYSPLGAGIFSIAAALSDYFVALFTAPIILAVLTGQKRWYILCGLLFLSAIFYSIRTSIAASLISLGVYLLMRYKLNAVPGLIALVIGFASIVVYVPEINQKFFYGVDKKDYTVEQIATGEVGFDDMQTNARDYMWTKAMGMYYHGQELTGNGLGSTAFGMKSHLIHPQLELIHSDYVQLLCDSGIISVILLGIFVIITLVTILWYGQPYLGEYTALTGWLAASSLCGILFSMAFDNVVSTSMTSLCISFILIGFFLKFKDLYRYVEEKDFTAEILEEDTDEDSEQEYPPQLEAESKIPMRK